MRYPIQTRLITLVAVLLSSSALLAADGKLEESAVWRQESIVGSVFDATYRKAGDKILPSIRGRAWVTAETTLVLEMDDPFCWGIPG